MSRQEFPRKVLAQGFLRAGGCCEKCHARLKTGESEGDHILPCALGGDNSLENLQILCKVCHKEKTKNDVRSVRKADRQRDKYTGAKTSTSRPIPGSKRSGIRKRMNGTVERW